MIPIRFTTFAAVILASLSAAAHDIVRTKTWMWTGNSSTPDAVMCAVEEVDHWRVNKIGDSWNYCPQAKLFCHRAHSAQELVYTDFTGTHRIRLRHAESPYGYERDDALLDAVGAHEAWLVHTSEPTREFSFDSAYVLGLLLQWHGHWCVDKDADGYCDRIVLPSEDEEEDETLSLFYSPPMNAGEQTALASCLNSTRKVYQQVERTDYMISGVEKWPELLQWAKQCDAADMGDVPMNPLPVPEVSPLTMCALFHGWLFRNVNLWEFVGDGRYAYMCDLDESFDDDHTGQDLRDAAVESRGEYSGFVCEPHVEQTPSYKPDLRFNSSGLRKIKGAPRRLAELEENREIIRVPLDEERFALPP